MFSSSRRQVSMRREEGVGGGGAAYIAEGAWHQAPGFLADGLRVLLMVGLRFSCTCG